MTTTKTVDLTTTLSSIVSVTQTALVKGILQVDLDSASSGDGGITLANKDAKSSSLSSDTILSTISTITSTSTSTTSNASQTSSSSPRHNIESSLFHTSNSTKNSNIGLVIGIPIAVIGVVVIIVSLYFYMRSRRRRLQSTEAKLKTHYDDKMNYRISPLNETSPYQSRTIYQVKKPPAPDLYSHYVSSNIFDGSSDIPSYHTNVNKSDLSLKEPPTGQINSLWNLNTPLSKWFIKHSHPRSASSRASLSTGPVTPALALKEFKLYKKRSELDEKSPILPRFPEVSYHPTSDYSSTNNPYSLHSNNLSFGSDNHDIAEQVIRADFTKTQVPKLQNINNSKKQKRNKNLNKPLPEKPSTAISLEGLEKIVYERMIPTTPKVDFSKYQNDATYRVLMDYTAKLADELTIKRGESVKILARHTDGWCLAEKVDLNGRAIVQKNSYINEGRGVIPEICLEKLDS